MVEDPLKPQLRRDTYVSTDLEKQTTDKNDFDSSLTKMTTLIRATRMKSLSRKVKMFLLIGGIEARKLLGFLELATK